MVPLYAAGIEDLKTRRFREDRLRCLLAYGAAGTKISAAAESAATRQNARPEGAGAAQGLRRSRSSSRVYQVGKMVHGAPEIPARPSGDQRPV